MTKRVWIAWIGAVVLGAVVSGCGLFAQRPANPVLATVNGQRITNSYWREAIDGLGVLNGQKLPTDTADKKSQVRQLMVWSAVEQWTLAHHLTTEQKARRQASKLVGQLEASAGGTKSLAKDLKTFGLTVPEFTDFLTGQQILETAFTQETAHVPPPSLAAERRYYNENQSQFMNPQSDQVEVILVKSAKEAHSIETQLKHGADFAALAKKDSRDPSAAQGGELGNIPLSASSGLPESFLNVLSGLSAGQYGIADTPSGYYVMEVQKVTPPSEQAFSSVRAAISTTLLNNIKNEMFQNWGTRIEKGYKTTFLMK